MKWIPPVLEPLDPTMALLLLGWVALQVNPRQALDRFDAGRPMAASKQQPKRPREVPLPLARLAQKDAVNLEREETAKAIAAPARPEPQHQSQPSNDANSAPQRQGTYGFAIRQLDLTFEAELPDARFIQLVREQGCEVVALKVQEEVIVDAFLPGETELLRRVTGPLASYRFDRYRTERPLSRHFWIRWQEPESPIGRQARAELQRCGVSATDYFVYLVLGEHLSRQIQEQLAVETQRLRIQPDKVGHAKIVLSRFAGSLVPSVPCVRPIPETSVQPAAIAEPRQPGAESQPAAESLRTSEPFRAVGSENRAGERESNR